MSKIIVRKPLQQAEVKDEQAVKRQESTKLLMQMKNRFDLKRSSPQGEIAAMRKTFRRK